MSLPAIKSEVNKTVLQNGLTIVSEHIPAYRSVAVGVWVKVGSRYEKNHQKGIVHFIEHMLFKGTENRTAFEIAQSLEKYGGQLNAFTGKEETCFYIHTLDTHLESGLEILADMLCNPLFSTQDIELEKQVVLEEMSAVRDTPEEYIFDLFQEKCYPDQPMGFPILGDKETVKAFSQADLYGFWKNYYFPGNLVIAVAGNVDHQSLVEKAGQYFNMNSTFKETEIIAASISKSINYTFRDTINQAHICIGNEAVSYFSDDRFSLMALSAYLGGGLSAKLFQVLREELGYVYSVYSFLDFYRDTGVFGFYMGTDVKNQKKAIKRLFEETEKLVQEGLSTDIVIILHEQLIGRFFLSMESTFKRMSRLAKNELYYKEHIDPDTIIKSIKEITSESIYKAAEKYLKTGDFNQVVIAPGKK